MRNLLKHGCLKVSGGITNISYSKNEIFITLEKPNDTVLFNEIGFGWLGWSKGQYNYQNIVVAESEYNGYKISYNSGQTITFHLTPFK
jgi:hypothetical protein